MRPQYSDSSRASRPAKMSVYLNLISIGDGHYLNGLIMILVTCVLHPRQEGAMHRCKDGRFLAKVFAII